MSRIGENHLAIASIHSAFSQRPQLRKRIHDVIDKDSSLMALFKDVAEYIKELTASSEPQFEIPATKKRKLNGADASEHQIGNFDQKNAGKGGEMDAPWPSVPMPDVSFSVPQRKKLLLQISPQPSLGIRALNPTTKEKEFGVCWRDIEHIVCLPVPEKAQAAYNFVVFPKYGNGITGPPEGASSPEPLLWTVPGIKAKEVEEGKEDLRKTMIKAIEQTASKVHEPNVSEFQSQIPQTYKKEEKIYHVKGFRGSKDGFLFFLGAGIVWGFKKPLCFFSFDTIDSISYTSVLQRTFNLNIATRTPSPSTNSNDPVSQEFEFSMIDQLDFAGIDAYIKRHGLQDASMAEQRRAKILNINGVKGKDGGSAGEEQGSALEKARLEADAMQENDEEEEEDENFDPGSEGESEGSGTSDGEDGDDPGDYDGHGAVEGEEGEAVDDLGSEDEMAR